MRLFFGLLGSLWLASIVSAQVPEVRQGSFELGGFVGTSYGSDSGYRIMGGGNLSYAATKMLLPYVEYSYFPAFDFAKISQTGQISGSNNMYFVTSSAGISDFHGGVHVRFIHKESKFVPYAVLGLGGLTLSNVTSQISYTSQGQTVKLPAITAPGTTAFAINFGAGVRYYISPRYGVRIEAKGYKPFGDKNNGGITDPFMKAEFGFFIQFK